MNRIQLNYPISTNRYWRVFGGRVVRSSEAVSYKSHVHREALEAGVVEPLEGPVWVEVSYHPKKPKKSTGKAVRAIDLDNVLKVAIDALNQIAWVDDSQIVRILVLKSEPIAEGGLVVEWGSE